MSTGNPAWFVAGREPYRGKWRMQADLMTKPAAEEYAAELVEMGWRDVMTADLTVLRHDLVTLGSGEYFGSPPKPPRSNGRLRPLGVTS